MTGKHPQIEYIDVVEYIMYNAMSLFLLSTTVCFTLNWSRDHFKNLKLGWLARNILAL